MTEALTIDRTHEWNTHSQSGEDGVIATICAALGIERGTAVEFGAWDGVHLSNTALLREAGWETCLIEGHPGRYAALASRFGGDSKVVTVNAWVAMSGEMSLDAILARHFDKPIDVLSIDIDGDDYHVLASLKTRPRIVVIEYNPTIPPPIDRVNPQGTSKGTSLGAFARLAGEKDYDLVHVTANNVILVDASRNRRIRPKTAFEAFDWDRAAFVISDFDGANWVLNGNGVAGRAANPWSGAPAVRLLGPPPRIWMRRFRHWVRGRLAG